MLVACGAAPKPVAVEKPVASAAPVEEERTPYAELAPQPAATELDGVWVRVESIKRTFNGLPELVKALPPLVRLQDLVEGRSGLLPADVAAVIDPAQPIDLTMPLSFTLGADAPIWAFHVRSDDAIAQGAAGLTLRRVRPGVWNMGGVVATQPQAAAGDDDESEPSEEGDEPPEDTMPPVEPVSCQLWHLPAPVGYRVVCSQNIEAIEQTAPFLLSPARSTSASRDLHLELSGPSYAKSCQRLLQTLKQTEKARSSAEHTGEQIVERLFGALLEHDRLALDLKLDNLRAQAQLELVYGEHPSTPGFAEWLTQSSRATLPPSYARLPADSRLNLGFNLGPNVVSFLMDEIERSIDEDTLTPPTEKREMLESLRGIFPPDGRASLAMGMDVPAALEALDNPAVQLADDADKPLRSAAVAQLQAALGGWVVIGVDEPPARYLAAAKRAYRAGKLKWRDRPGREQKNKRSDSDFVSLSGAPRGLPRDTLHIVSAVRPNRKYVPPADGSAPAILPYDEHMLLVPDEQRVWIVYARSEALAVKQAQALLSSSASREGAKAPNGVLAAALQVALFGVSEVHGDSKSERKAARRVLAAIDRAPGRAQLPVPLLMQVLPRQDAPGFVMRLESSAQLDELIAQGFALVPQGD
jgi:hypothetical protein